MLEAALTFTDKTSGEQSDVFLHCVGSEVFHTNTKGSSSKTKPLLQGWKKYRDFTLELKWMLSILLH